MDKRINREHKKANATTVLCLVLVLALMPGMAFAGPIEDGVDWLLDLLTSGIARSAAIVAIAILGYMAWVGKLTWEKAGSFMIGVVLVFGGAALVDILIAAVSTT